jgi:hypothetical protein
MKQPLKPNSIWRCGGDGEVLVEYLIDEGEDYADYFVEMTNGTASVQARRDISYDGDFYNDIVYEVFEYECR